MSTKWQKIDITIPKGYSSLEKQAIGVEIVRFIQRRTADGLDKNGNEFAGYSDSYIKSLNFKIAGKSKGDVNLTLSGDMLGALDVLDVNKNKIRVGYEDGSNENAIADGNIRGTYGNTKSVGPKRNFLGISKADLAEILINYDDEDHAQTVLDSIDEAEFDGE